MYAKISLTAARCSRDVSQTTLYGILAASKWAVRGANDFPFCVLKFLNNAAMS